MINKVIHLFFSLLFLFSSWFSAYSVKYAVIENFNDVKYVSSSTSFYDVSPIICNEGDYRSFRVNKSPKLTSVFYLSLTNFNLYKTNDIHKTINEYIHYFNTTRTI